MSETVKRKGIEEFFGPMISTYTDAQAVEDGTLVAVTRKDRVTRAVWNWLIESLPESPKPPDCWPVEMMGWFRAKSADDRALAAARGLIGMHGTRAHEVYEKNLDGGIFTLVATERDGKIDSLLAFGVEPAKTLWLLPNENDGVTLLFPEDN